MKVSAFQHFMKLDGLLLFFFWHILANVQHLSALYMNTQMGEREKSDFPGRP